MPHSDGIHFLQRSTSRVCPGLFVSSQPHVGAEEDDERTRRGRSPRSGQGSAAKNPCPVGVEPSRLPQTGYQLGSSQDARDPKAAHTHAQYFSNQQTRMDYPRYARMGLPIGSKIIEGACKTVLKQRLSASGTRWTRPGAQAVATLRALHRSHQWDAWWRTQPYRRPSPSVT